jgi:ubiquinone biosynthesis protein
MKATPSHFKRYREIASLLWKYGRSDLAQQIGTDDGLTPPPKPEDLKEANKSEVTPDQLADDLEAMGPTYVKFGQVLAGRPDLLPESYRTALSRLQDKVKPFPYSDVERIVEEELGVRISKAFGRFDQEPIAAASLGQVHSAALRDGREVVVKVQRPDIRAQIAEDFEVLEKIASMLDNHTKVGQQRRFGTMLEEFKITIANELNYQREAQNLRALSTSLEDFELIQVPQPIEDYSTEKVLTMECINGRKITSLTPLARLDVKGEPLCEELFRAYLKQVLVDGLFHADPHPGNVFLTEEHRIALIDLGMVGHTAPHMQENLLKLLLAVSDGNSEDAADVVIRMSEKNEDFNRHEFRRKVNQLLAQKRDQGIAQMKVGASLIELSNSAAENGLYVPSELTLLGKTLMQLDEIGRILAPQFDPNAAIRRNVDELLAKKMRRDLTKGNVMSSVLESKAFLSALPSRLNRIMDAITNAELEVKVKSVDAKVVMQGMQKIANRITCGVILASMVIGASLMMKIDTPARLLGYPRLAILTFLGAGAGGAYLVLSIFIQDYKDRKKIKR